MRRDLPVPAPPARPASLALRFGRGAVALLTPLVGLALASSGGQTLFSAAALELPGCSNVDAGGVTPLTGIVILSDTLTTGHGCGTGADQVFEYATIVTIPSDAGTAVGGGSYVTGGTSPCYANATFDDVCEYIQNVSDTNLYDISIYAFNQAQWNQTLTEADGGSTVTEALSRANSESVSVNEDGGLTECVGRVPASTVVYDVNNSIQAGWTTTCTAEQQLNAPVTALCGPLLPTSP